MDIEEAHTELYSSTQKRENNNKRDSHIWMNSLHFGANHLQRRPHNKIPTFFQVINSTKVKNKKGSRRSVHGTLTKKFLLAAWLSESPAWNIAALPRRERNPNMLNPPKGRRASKRRACQAAANESWTWKQSRQAWQSQRDAGIVCKQNTKKRRASKESLTSVTSSTYWQTITIGCRRDNCCRVKKKQPSPPPNKKGDKEKKRRGWEKKECRRENERKNERETERKRMPVA